MGSFSCWHKTAGNWSIPLRFLPLVWSIFFSPAVGLPAPAAQALRARLLFAAYLPTVWL